MDVEKLRAMPPGDKADCTGRAFYVGFLCTLDEGHTGPHVAHNSYDEVVAVWSGGEMWSRAVERLSNGGGSR